MWGTGQMKNGTPDDVITTLQNDKQETGVPQKKNSLSSFKNFDVWLGNIKYSQNENINNIVARTITFEGMEHGAI